VRLHREVALANVIVGFHILDGRGVNDPAFVDDGGVVPQAKAEMHILLRDQNRRTGTTQLPQQLDLRVAAQICVAVMKDGEVVEQGLAGDVFGRPQHPYTQALLDSIPGGAFARKHETSLFT